MIRHTAVAVALLTLLPLSGFASEKSAGTSSATPPAELQEETPLASVTSWPRADLRAPATRPAALPALYVSLAAFQGLDGYSTLRGLHEGAREGNPVMRPIVGNPVQFWAVKAAATVLPIAIAEHLWKGNKTAAVVTMMLANGLSAAVALHNASVLKQLR
jgi:hypothetical protein